MRTKSAGTMLVLLVKRAGPDDLMLFRMARSSFSLCTLYFCLSAFKLNFCFSLVRAIDGGLDF